MFHTQAYASPTGNYTVAATCPNRHVVFTNGGNLAGFKCPHCQHTLG